MEFQKLPTVKRDRIGKGPARRLRQQGLIPAIDPRLLVKALSGPMRTNTILELTINGASETCPAMVRDHQFDPVSRELLHVDLLAVNLDKEIEVEIPLVLQGRSQGEQLGGTLSKLFRTLPVKCYPKDIPAAVTADITSLQLNAIMTAGDLVLPENVALLVESKTPVVTIATKRAETQEAGEGEAAAGGEAQEAQGKPETSAS
jgi:large subunit ribosomal protein L25